MNITVILCTFNRAGSLPTALESVICSELPSSIEWEVLVVDNNSSDDTREVAEQFCRRYPDRVRYLFEPVQGKSNALNRGIREAQGDILAFVDDDVTAQPDWLRSLTSPLLQQDVWVGVGGRILPPPTFKPPAWMALDGRHAVLGVLALFDHGPKGIELAEAPYGTNMAFRRQVFEKYGGFRADLGPCPGSEIRGEDTEFGRRLLGAGERLWYQPSAVICHPVPEDRLRQEYFLRFFFDHGRAMIRERGAGRPIWFFRRCNLTLLNIALTRLPPRVLRWLLAPGEQRRFHSKVMVWMTFGQLAELLRVCRQTGRRSEDLVLEESSNKKAAVKS
jgi:glycosyltransferase involved in cell wall biosynthesis